MSGDYNGPATYNNASPVYYNGILYAFYSTEEKKIRYRMRKDTTSWR